MNEEIRRRGRPPKTLDYSAAAVMTPAAETSSQADTIEQVITAPSVSAESIIESKISDVISIQADYSAKESPIEEKIHELVKSQCPPGFNPISSAPKDGNRLIVSETGEDRESVYWRVRRVVDKKNLRYIKEGKWTSLLSRLDIDYEPKYWCPYTPDYIPVSRTQ